MKVLIVEDEVMAQQSLTYMQIRRGLALAYVSVPAQRREGLGKASLHASHTLLLITSGILYRD